MNIAFLAVKNILRGGGIEKYTFELGSRLAGRGHAVTVYSMIHYGEISDSVNGMKIVPVFSLKRPCLQKMTASLSAALHTLRRQSFDIVHLHSVASGAFGVLPRLRGPKTILQMHGIEWQRSRWGRKGSSVLEFLERFSIKQASAVTAVSKKQCEYLQDRYGCSAEYIPTATEVVQRLPAREISRLGLTPGGYILFVARLVEEKGADCLIRAFRNVKTDLRLVVAGDSPGQNGYKSILHDLAKGDNRIIFPGYVEGKLLIELFSNAYLYTQPSRLEGLSIALLEAMSYGKCCLVSDIGENLEPVGGAGYSFRDGDAGDLAAKLKWLVDNPAKVHEVESKAIERVRQEYTWDVVTRKMESFYQRTLSGQS